MLTMATVESGVRRAKVGSPSKSGVREGESMDLHWYPGQMAKAVTNIKKKLKLVDLVIEVRDARIPDSSKNPAIDDILQGKKRLIVLNKEDLADESMTARWKNLLDKAGFNAVLVSSASGKGIKKIPTLLKSLASADKPAFRKNMPLRLMVVGIPNVGKSTLINKISTRAATRTGNRPGVTRGEQWVKLVSGMELLDTPGILWTKLDDQEAAFKLAVTGAIKYELLDDYNLSTKLLQYLVEKHPDRLKERYSLETITEEPEKLLLRIGKNRGALLPGGRIDTDKAAGIVLVEFRQGKLGRFTLDEI